MTVRLSATGKIRVGDHMSDDMCGVAVSCASGAMVWVACMCWQCVRGGCVYVMFIGGGDDRTEARWRIRWCWLGKRP